MKPEDRVAHHDDVVDQEVSTLGGQRSPGWGLGLWAVALALIATFAVIGVQILGPAHGGESPVPANPDQAAAAFAEAYAAGDTVRACTLTSGRARALMQDRGWCQEPAGWEPSTPVLLRRCTLTSTEGGDAFIYEAGMIDGYPGFSITIHGTDGAYLVTALGRGGVDNSADGRKLCPA